MLIILHPKGMMGNRLILFSHFLSCAYEYGFKLYYLCLDDYEEFFKLNEGAGKVIAKTRCSRNRFVNIILKNIIRIMYRIAIKLPSRNNFCKVLNIAKTHDAKDMAYLMGNDDFANDARRKMLFAEGWGYRDYISIGKHGDRVRSFFDIKEVYKKRIDNIFSEYGKYSKIIGVHIRLGDYKDFLNGKFLYDNDVYTNFINQVKTLFKGDAIAFLLCSNEKVDFKFEGIEVLSSTGKQIEDMYALSRCNYIIGPPSTFSMWASFYGRVPLCLIQNKDQKITLKDFIVYGI